jgi:hypothetical protein
MRFDVNGNAAAEQPYTVNGWYDTGRMEGSKKIWEYHGHTTSGSTNDVDVVMTTLSNIDEIISLRGFLYSNNNNMKYPINFYRRASDQNIYSYINGTGQVILGWHVGNTSDNTFANRPVYWTLETTRTDA